MSKRKSSTAVRTVAALMTVIIILGSGWWFRDDLKEMLNLTEKPEDALAELLNDPFADKDITLTVQTMLDLNFDPFKKPFIIRHPSVTINLLGLEMTTLYEPDKFKAYMEKSDQTIDLYMLPLKQFTILAAEGKLKGLDALFKKHDIDLDSYYPPLVDLIRLAGDGELYGFTAGYSSTALFVNRKLFEEHGIPLPEEGDSLDEILDTAARFKGTGVYGMATGSGFTNRGLSQFTAFIGQSNGLKTLTLEKNRLTASLNSKSWKEVWQQVADGYKDGWLGESPPINWNAGSVTHNQIFAQELFANGKTAMTIGDGAYYRDLSLYESREGGTSLDWITIPYEIDPAATNQSNYLGTGFVYAINAKSQNAEAAWELLRFIVGEEMAVKNDRITDNQPFDASLAANPSSMKSLPEEKWRGFYGMKADPAHVLSEIQVVSDKYYGIARDEFFKLSKEQLNAVIDGSKTIDDALSDLQAKLDEYLLNYGERGAG
ncbi:hypothetical protein PAECIP111893_02785 [Paenibacillus plantiphilus]|uniref:ABC transporter substrate-binding protein n=1 Tax=Paenibacillus plantiphilus TaxID=2905650 RepID=A0ABM9CBT6_9BACL|nr:extracellular solute-binding protein [Paenibacillus plantiphilus]CAH1207805.1 hypothetical protein PAECIP111893_02785 [Paenibacillus plantiphilus]